MTSPNIQHQQVNQLFK